MATIVDVDTARAPAFGLKDDHAPFHSEPHTHTRHQILYAVSGVLSLEAESSQWVLPPERAAWIPAGVMHVVRTRVPIRLRTIYLATPLVPSAPPVCGIFGVSALAREMILHAMQWGPETRTDDPIAKPFFAALAALVPGWLADEKPYRLPVAKSPELARAMRFALDHLDEELSAEHGARAAGVSARTLTRRFAEETGTSWRVFVHTARMLRAMELLSSPKVRVTEAAYAVGFKSLGAFTTAFGEFAGETPKEYRRRRSAILGPHAH
ncbi:helix-turn-helix transcriptional regulator [Pendulispora rubella]|uniref:Helix-turn-helix transcriptional regulator n=1 Tax=Pendulispora rubella TaxID=2741070 RepID=A0ABZ2L7T1_9BACT